RTSARSKMRSAKAAFTSSARTTASSSTSVPLVHVEADRLRRACAARVARDEFDALIAFEEKRDRRRDRKEDRKMSGARAGEVDALSDDQRVYRLDVFARDHLAGDVIAC